MTEKCLEGRSFLTAVELCPPGKDLPALAALAAQEADDAEDGGERHLGQPGEEVARGGDGVLLLAGDSIEKFWLEFRLEKWLEIPF